MTTAFEVGLRRALGDWLSPWNPIPRCKQCHGFHEEPQRVLHLLTGWPCTRVQKYHTEVFDRCLEAATFAIALRRFRRLAPHWRIGAHLGDESDEDYTRRMLALEKARPDWDLLLHSEGEKDLKRFEGLRLPSHLQEKADDIKRRFPISKKSPPRRPRKLAPGQRPVSVRAAATGRKVRQSASRRPRKTAP